MSDCQFYDIHAGLTVTYVAYAPLTMKYMHIINKIKLKNNGMIIAYKTLSEQPLYWIYAGG